MRVSLFDNIKGIAIILVVVGHFCTRVGSVDDSHLIQTAMTFIYLFHMPLFIFCSGLFAGRSWYKKKGGHKAPVDKVLLYLSLYLIFCSLVAVFDLVLLGSSSTINPFVIGSAPWFMLALAIFFIFIPVMGSIRPVAFMAASIAIAIAANVLMSDAKEFTLLRVMVYLPYFALGFYLQDKGVLSFVEKARNRVRAGALVAGAWFLLAALFVVLFALPDTFLVALKQLSSGANLLPAMSDKFGVSVGLLCIARFLEYFVVFLVGTIVVLATPTSACFLTFMGERSFQVYIGRMFVIYTLDACSFYAIACASSWWWTLTPFVFGPILTALLAWPKAPNDWVKSLGKLCKNVVSNEEKRQMIS